MTKHVFNKILMWDIPTEAGLVKSLCEKCGQEEDDDSLECVPMRVSTGFYDPKYLDKALRALTEVT